MPLLRLLFVAAAGLWLTGCATNVEKAAEILAQRPPQTCSTVVDGERVEFTGKACDRLAGTAAQRQAMSACASFSADNEALCVLAVTLGGKSPTQGSQDDELRMLTAAMQADTQIKAAWIGNIPVLGNLAATAYQVHESEKTMRTAFRNGGTRVGTLNITKSDDGTATSGEGAATGSGGNGDMYTVIGNRNQTIPGDGSIITRGRNPVLIGTGQPNSSLDPSYANNQNATAPDNPINNAPVVSTSDDDGGQSIIPKFTP